MLIAVVTVPSAMDTWMQSPKMLNPPTMLQPKSCSLVTLVTKAAQKHAPNLEDTVQELVVKRHKINKHIVLTDSEDDST